MQWGFFKYVLSKKIKTDTCDKFTFNSYYLVLKCAMYTSNLELKH